MEKNYDNHLIYRIIRYGLNNESFTLTKLFKDLNLTEQEQEFVRYHFLKDSHNEKPNHIIAYHEPFSMEGSISLSKKLISVLPNAVFQFNDYLEIKAAREAAKESKRLAWVAIGLSLVVGIIQIAVSIYYAK
jgi:hypothetical protein